MPEQARQSDDGQWVNEPEAVAALAAARARLEREASFDDGRLLQGVREGHRLATGVLAVGLVKDIFKALGRLPDDA